VLVGPLFFWPLRRIFFRNAVFPCPTQSGFPNRPLCGPPSPPPHIHPSSLLKKQSDRRAHNVTLLLPRPITTPLTPPHSGPAVSPLPGLTVQPSPYPPYNGTTTDPLPVPPLFAPSLTFQVTTPPPFCFPGPIKEIPVWVLNPHPPLLLNAPPILFFFPEGSGFWLLFCPFLPSQQIYPPRRTPPRKPLCRGFVKQRPPLTPTSRGQGDPPPSVTLSKVPWINLEIFCFTGPMRTLPDSPPPL